MTTSTSRSASAASHASRCPRRNAGKPKWRCSAAERSTGGPGYRRSRRARGDRARSVTEDAGTRLALFDRELLERELAVGVGGALEGVLAGEAGIAVRATLAADRLVDALQREVGQRVAAQLLGDLLDRAVVGHHLLLGRHVDPVVAGVADRRRGDPHVHPCLLYTS